MAEYIPMQPADKLFEANGPASLDAEHTDPTVLLPSSSPSGSRFETATYNYACGMPELPQPEWLKMEALQRQQQVKQKFDSRPQ